MANDANPQMNPDGLDYLRGMCERYARRDGDRIVIDLTVEEQAALGMFVIQAVFGFFLNIQQSSDRSSGDDIHRASPVHEETFSLQTL